MTRVLPTPYNWNMTNKEQKPTKDQLKVMALKQRIGEITSDYEEKIADIRAYVTQAQEEFEEILRRQETDIESLQAQLRTYQDATVEAEAELTLTED